MRKNRDLNFSQLNEHKFGHNFKRSVSPMCRSGFEIESTLHIFLCCHFYHVERSELLNSVYNIDLAINELNEDSTINLVLFSSEKYHKEINRKTLLN